MELEAIQYSKTWEDKDTWVAGAVKVTKELIDKFTKSKWYTTLILTSYTNLGLTANYFCTDVNNLWLSKVCISVCSCWKLNHLVSIDKENSK